MKTALIIGAGPAGLTAAYELLKQSDEIKVIVLEESECCGGISKTVAYKGNRMDMGGHRFFSKMESVNEWWEKVLPAQGAPALDDIILQRSVPISPNGPDPQKEDRVFLNRRRVSRILFDGKFYDYPISLKWETLTNMGIVKTIEVGFSYLNSLIHKLPENSLENFYINRFGKKLYSKQRKNNRGSGFKWFYTNGQNFTGCKGWRSSYERTRSYLAFTNSGSLLCRKLFS